MCMYITYITSIHHSILIFALNKMNGNNFMLLECWLYHFQIALPLSMVVWIHNLQYFILWAFRVFCLHYLYVCLYLSHMLSYTYFNPECFHSGFSPFLWGTIDNCNMTVNFSVYQLTDLSLKKRFLFLFA